MKIYKNIKALTRNIDKIKKDKKTIGFVPTMGYLHDGHLSLIRKAKKDTDCVVVSIFVNPAQFGPNEDLDRYPRDLKRDFRMCREESVDMIFMPEVKEMYPEGYCTYVVVEGLSDKLCGASRPGHFRGVSTILTKLFNLIKPDIAYFGQKDAQQAVIIKRMAEDLNISSKIKVMPIIREKDGLAMSSRNIYLSPAGRKNALYLYKSLKLAEDLFNKRNRNAKEITSEIKKQFSGMEDAKIDYMSIVCPESLDEVDTIKDKALFMEAVWIGGTRLIDNVILREKK